MEMRNPEYMVNYSDRTYRIIKDVIEDLNIPWEENEYILDIGCGPGIVSANILSNLAPKNSQMVAGDISINMIDYARKNCSQPGIIFELMDITDCAILKKWEGKFTTIFCFFTFQRIVDFRKAYENLYRLLKPGGKLLFIFPTNHPFEKIFPHLAKIPKYKDYSDAISKMKITMAPHDDELSYSKNLLKKVGFEIMFCGEKILDHSIDAKQSHSDMLSNSFPISRILPNDLLQDALNDSNKLINEILLDNKDDAVFNGSITLLMVFAKKPAHNL